MNEIFKLRCIKEIIDNINILVPLLEAPYTDSIHMPVMNVEYPDSYDSAPYTTLTLNKSINNKVHPPIYELWSNNHICSIQFPYKAPIFHFSSQLSSEEILSTLFSELSTMSIYKTTYGVEILNEMSILKIGCSNEDWEEGRLYITSDLHRNLISFETKEPPSPKKKEKTITQGIRSYKELPNELK